MKILKLLRFVRSEGGDMAGYRMWGAISFIGALSMCGASAQAEIDFSSKMSCPGVWVNVPSANFETVKVCKREAVVATVPVERKRKAVLIRPRSPVRHASIARHHPVVVERVAVAQAPANLECTSLMCPQFLLVGVGF